MQNNSIIKVENTPLYLDETSFDENENCIKQGRQRFLVIIGVGQVFLLAEAAPIKVFISVYQLLMTGQLLR